MAISKFKKNLGVSTSSSIISFLISIGLSPIMTRLYSPEDYGIFSLINTIGIFIITLSMFSIQSAFSIEKSHLRKVQLLGLLTNIGVLTFLIVSISVLLLFLIVPSFSWYYLLLPILILGGILQRTFFSLSVSHEKFLNIAKARVAHPFVAKVFAILAALVSQSNALFLILFEAFGYFVQTYILFKNKETKNIKKYVSKIFDFKSYFSVMKRYKSFISYYHLSNLMFIGFSMIQVMIISINYSEYETGLFSLASSMSNLPIQLISLALASVLYQKMNTIYKSGECLFSFIIKIILGFSAIGLIPYGIIYFYSVDIFTFVFGNQWSTSGTIAGIICLNLYMFFIFMPLNSMFNIINKLKIKFYFDLLLIAIILFFYLYSKNHEFISSIILLSYGLFVYYLILTLVVVYLSRESNNENTN